MSRFTKKSLAKLESLFIAALIIKMMGCSESTLPEVQTLTGLRVLGISADIGGRAEFAPGESGITVTPIISDINETTSLNFEAFGCADPGIAFGAEPNCDRASDRVSLSSGNTGLSLATQFTGEATPLTVSIPATFLDGRSSVEKLNGINYLIDYRVTNSSGSVVKAFKRLKVSENPIKNNNPILSDITNQGVSLTALTTQSTLTVSLVPGSSWSEDFQAVTTSGELVNRTEEVLVTWFTNTSDWKSSRTVNTDSNELNVNQSVPLSGGKKWVIVVVVRDGRGGLDHVVRVF